MVLFVIYCDVLTVNNDVLVLNDIKILRCDCDQAKLGRKSILTIEHYNERLPEILLE